MGKDAEREKRLADALRANLRKRKVAANGTGTVEPPRRPEPAD